MHLLVLFTARRLILRLPCISCGYSSSTLVACLLFWYCLQATVKGSVVIRRKRNFRITPDAMVCQSPTMDDDYIERARLATLERYAGAAAKAAELKALQGRLFTAHESAVDAAGGQGAGGSSTREDPDADCVAVDLDNLSAIASRRGKITATTQKANMAVLRAAFKHRTEGKSRVDAKILAAAGESGGLPVPPDVGTVHGRGALGADEADGGTAAGALKQLQRCLSAHGASRQASRSLSLALSPLRLRAPDGRPGGRLAADGVVDTLAEAAGGERRADEPAGGAAGLARRSVADLDASGVYAVFFAQFVPKTDEAYLSLVERVMVQEGLSGAVVSDEGTPVADLVALFQPAMSDAKLWSFGHRQALDIFFRSCRSSPSLQ